MIVYISYIIFGIYTLYYTRKNSNKFIALGLNNREVIDEFKTKFLKCQSLLYYSISILIILFGILGITNVFHFKAGYLCILIYAIPSIVLRKYTKNCAK